MPNSSYYYSQYRQYKNSVASLQRNIETLTRIRDSIAGDYYDEQRNVNQELNDLKEDLGKAARHDNSWNTIVSQCESYKEKASTADGNLYAAIDYLDAEISSLSSQKSTAETNREQSYSDYQSKRDEERQAWLDSLKKKFV